MRFLLLALLVGCTGHSSGSIDQVVGAACAADRDCANRCFLDSQDFPGGFCSNACTSDADCPGDTVCVGQAGGVCLFTCPPMDCNSLGPRWHCSDKDLVGGGKASVCTGD